MCEDMAAGGILWSFLSHGQNESVTTDGMNIKGYNVFRTDCANKGRGNAVYIKSKLNCN